MWGVKRFHPGNNVNQFITDLNKPYTIHVKSELAQYPRMETEFIKITKQLLDESIFQQIEDSQQTMSSYEELRAYLLRTHTSQIMNFQHLSRA